MNEFFEFLGCFHGCPCIPNRNRPIGKTEETLLKRYKKTMARWQKIGDAGLMLFRFRGEFRKPLRENPVPENELSSHPYLKNFPLIFRTTSTGVEPQPPRHVDVISLYPYICKYGKFPLGHTNVYVNADRPPNCVDRVGIIKCKVLPPRKLSSSSSVQKQLKLMFPLYCAYADTMTKTTVHTLMRNSE